VEAVRIRASTPTATGLSGLHAGHHPGRKAAVVFVPGEALSDWAIAEPTIA
jgi:hypothetical protein